MKDIEKNISKIYWLIIYYGLKWNKLLIELQKNDILLLIALIGRVIIMR